eukprot:5336082-Pyramimonas_sp.AAC.1
MIEPNRLECYDNGAAPARDAPALMPRRPRPSSGWPSGPSSAAVALKSNMPGGTAILDVVSNMWFPSQMAT